MPQVSQFLIDAALRAIAADPSAARPLELEEAPGIVAVRRGVEVPDGYTLFYRDAGERFDLYIK